MTKLDKKIEEELKSPKPKHRRAKTILAFIILAIVFWGLHSQLFISLGIFDFTAREPQRIELDVLQLDKIGVDVETFEADINHLVANMNNAQQGTHFLLGMISGLMFLQPTAGFTVGVIKELYDFTQNYRGGYLNKGYFLDAFVDIFFWFSGGFVGFYILSSLFNSLQTNSIRSPKDLVVHLGKKAWWKMKSK